MCYSVSIIYFGCTCRIESQTYPLLGFQPCTSGTHPQICDPRLNGRSCVPILSPATRFSNIWCAAHVRANNEAIGNDNSPELLPTVYPSVQDFLKTTAFNNNKMIKHVKNKLLFEAKMVELWQEQLKVLYKKRWEEMVKKEESERLKVAQATAEREAVERAAGAKPGALRPTLGEGFAALTLKKRRDEAKAQQTLEETQARKEKEAEEAKNQPHGTGRVVKPDEWHRPRQWTYVPTANQFRGGWYDAFAPPVVPPTPTVMVITNQNTASYRTQPSREVVDRDMASLAAASRARAPQIASSRKLPSQPKSDSKADGRRKDGPDEKKVDDGPRKVLDLDGVDLYE